MFMQCTELEQGEEGMWVELAVVVFCGNNYRYTSEKATATETSLHAGIPCLQATTAQLGPAPVPGDPAHGSEDDLSCAVGRV